MLDRRKVRSIVCRFGKHDYASFDAADVVSLGKALGWNVEPPPDNDWLLFCRIDTQHYAIGLTRTISNADSKRSPIPRDDRLLEFAICLHAWNGHDPEFHVDIAEWHKEADTFHRYFTQVSETVSKLLGPPIADAAIRNSVAPNSRYHAWPLLNGIVYLYKDDRDLQCGVEVGLQFKTWKRTKRVPKLTWQ